MIANKRPLPEKWLHDVEAIKVYADPRRLEIMRLMHEPTTVKAISVALDIAPSKLYYHIKLLLEHDIIEEVGYNIESGIVEKIYQATAVHFKVVNPLINTAVPVETADALFSSMLDDTTQQFRHALLNIDRDDQNPPRHPFLSKKMFKLSEAQLTAVHAKLVNLIEELAQLAQENENTDYPEYQLMALFNKNN
ncbi:MAG: helix-turn-helix domain-containing protein [Chloroflexota bacterium]